MWLTRKEEQTNMKYVYIRKKKERKIEKDDKRSRVGRAVKDAV